MICQRSLRIQCKYDTMESPGSISMTTQPVISMWLVMKWKRPVSSLYYAPYNLSRSHTFKPRDRGERVSVWNIFIIRNTCINILALMTMVMVMIWWWWWRWWRWWWWSLWFQCEQKPTQPAGVNTLRSKQNGHHFTDDIFKRIFLNENVPMFIPIIEMCSQKFN